MFNRARAFSPAGISSFFEICDMTSDGKLISDPELVGARGGGFSPCKGVLTDVVVAEAEKSRIQIYINKKFCPEAETTKSVVEMLTDKVAETYDVCVMHKVDVPVAAGFGSSAAGALSTSLALNKILRLNLTYNQLGKVAHVAEVKCKTGLGTVGPLLFGGCGLTLDPGAPGIARLDRIPVSPDHRLVMGTFRSYPTKEMLASGAKRELVNTWGRKALQRILADPSLENFMGSCKKFAFETGFATERVKKLMDLAEKAGAIGVAQNMIGEAVHALVTVNSVNAVYDAFKKLLPEEKIMISAVAYHGAHIIGC
jgi:pantoate kinase